MNSAPYVFLCIFAGVLFHGGDVAHALDPDDSISYRHDLRPGDDAGKFSSPMGAAIDDLGYIYVADTSAHRIVMFNPRGSYMESFGTEGSRPGQFYYPHGLSVGDLPGGRRGLYVVDGGNHRVQVFTDDGDPVRQFGSFGGGDGQLNTPAGIATLRGVPGSGVWVADTRNNRIVQFTTSGRWVKAIDCRACSHGPFVVPVGIALRPVGDDYRIYVSEEPAGRIRVLTSGGREIDTIGRPGSDNGELSYPDDIAVDKDGSLFVAEAGFGNERVSIFGPNGKFIRRFNHFGAIYQDPFVQPHGVAVGPAGQIVVVDSGQSKVHLFTTPPPAIVLFDVTVRTFKPLKAIFLTIYHNDAERKCDVGVEATFNVRTGGVRRSFTKTGALQGVGAAIKNLRIDLTAEQSDYFKSFAAAGVSAVFRARCGRTSVLSTARMEIE